MWPGEKRGGGSPIKPEKYCFTGIKIKRVIMVSEDLFYEKNNSISKDVIIEEYMN